LKEPFRGDFVGEAGIISRSLLFFIAEFILRGKAGVLGSVVSLVPLFPVLILDEIGI